MGNLTRYSFLEGFQQSVQVGGTRIDFISIHIIQGQLLQETPGSLRFQRWWMDVQHLKGQI